MGDMTLKERFVRSVKGEEVDKVPVCSVTQTGTVDLMELSGASWPKANYDPGQMATLAIAGHEIAGLEAVRYPFCTTVIAETLGCVIEEGSFDTQPYQLDFPCKKKEDAGKISIPEKLLESRRINTMLEATDIIRQKIGDDIPLVAGMIGPAATAFYLAGANNYLRWCITDPDELMELMRIGESVCAEYANALYERGADAVIIIDSEAGPDIFPPPMFESMILPVYKSLTAKLKGLKLLHMCGDATAILEPIAESGFQGVSIEEKVDVAYASQLIGDRVCLIGNVSPSETLLHKSREVIRREAKQCIDDGIGILAPGCGIAPRTPLEHLKAFVAARDEYYQEKGLL
ncbi:methylcobamide:CoM methyltransferase MtaA [Methanolobus chelungpuianus]|uniref:Methylcobamide:CoM methyltransferase n=1 Tax=Methanolobus chelungpuianus TaxID=502115 RepID=A0AAE3HBX6_9EURY|nr:methylcobamide:CoM methyltransferase MtaA [Methanolobus chelungpuianus]MCQ6963511.1 methylcobamide:CoM methyltransferase [Methanolobus chelungpuianus]